MNQHDMFGVLYLIGSAESGFKHRKRLHKMAMLAQLAESYPFSFSFEAYHYGPYSFGLQQLIDQMVSGRILIEKIVAEGPYKTYIYRLSSAGKEIVKTLKSSIATADIRKLDRIWAWSY